MRNQATKTILRLLIFSALLSSISIVCGKYLAFNMGEIMRFSFENMPIIFAGMAFGPLVGALVGVVSDLVGCLLVGYAINPIITVAAGGIGLISGISFFFSEKKDGGRLVYLLKISLTVGAAHIVGSVIIKSVGLSVFYSMPLYVLMLWRLLNYVIVGAVEGFLLYHLMKNKALKKQIQLTIPRISKGRTQMNYTEALEYIHSISWTFCKPGLERIGELCKALGNPEKKLKFVHVAGTNGKGSFCSMLSSVLVKGGLKVGLYTSPYIKVFNERMRINGENIPDETLARLTERVRPFAETMKDKPTEFELITAIAFLYFMEENCDIVVLEAGMGGRLDSTNIIENSVLSVITGVSLDHTAFLGDTTEKIAREKAGIIKPHVPVLFGGEDGEARKVISSVALANGSELFAPDYEKIEIIKADLTGTRFTYKNKEAKINLLGLYQPRNCALVLEAIDILGRCGFYVSENAVNEGLIDASWSARFEIINNFPLIIFDGAHNSEGISAATESIKYYFGDERVIILSGVLKDKDYSFIAKKLAEVASCAYTITPENSRALPAESFAELLSSLGIESKSNDTVKSALVGAIERAEKTGEAIVCLGSLYTYVDVIAELEKHYVSKRR